MDERRATSTRSCSKELLQNSIVPISKRRGLVAILLTVDHRLNPAPFAHITAVPLAEVWPLAGVTVSIILDNDNGIVSRTFRCPRYSCWNKVLWSHSRYRSYSRSSVESSTIRLSHHRTSGSGVGFDHSKCDRNWEQINTSYYNTLISSNEV